MLYFMYPVYISWHRHININHFVNRPLLYLRAVEFVIHGAVAQYPVFPVGPLAESVVKVNQAG